MSKWDFHQLSLMLLNSKTAHNNLVPKILLLTVADQKTHIRLRLSFIFYKSFTWCDLQIKSRLFVSRNFRSASGPNKHPIPRYLFSENPFCFYAGSDHNKSETIPLIGISRGLFTFINWLILVNSGPIPPCIQNIRSSINAARGIELKTSTNIFQTFTEYFRLP